MDLTNTLIIGSAVAIILLLWIVVGFRHLSNLRNNFSRQWAEIANALCERHDLLPNMIETLRIHDQGKEAFIGKMIETRQKAAREYYPGVEKIEYEYDFSNGVKELIGFSKEIPELNKDTNFLELRTEFEYIGRELEGSDKRCS